jgi:hypothetical protein
VNLAFDGNMQGWRRERVCYTASRCHRYRDHFKKLQDRAVPISSTTRFLDAYSELGGAGIVIPLRFSVPKLLDGRKFNQLKSDYISTSRWKDCANVDGAARQTLAEAGEEQRQKWAHHIPKCRSPAIDEEGNGWKRRFGGG